MTQAQALLEKLESAAGCCKARSVASNDVLFRELADTLTELRAWVHDEVWGGPADQADFESWSRAGLDLPDDLVEGDDVRRS